VADKDISGAWKCIVLFAVLEQGWPMKCGCNGAVKLLEHAVQVIERVSEL